jgi:LAO/AO transport system kinase
MSSRLPSVAGTCERVRAGDRRTIAKTITLLESRRPDQAARGQEILEKLVPCTGGSIRVGITGAPGVGKSTFIEALGLRLIEEGQRVAVLAVDPTSPVSGGSILGDKTRMERLAQQERAFIRPSPSGGSLGGVAERTREVLLLAEAAGFDVVVVETVGIGQSEVAVHSMVDCFTLLLQPGAGDELQGIKKGVLELADALVVTKADGELCGAAERSRGDYSHALALLRPVSPFWQPRVLSVSALSGDGIDAFSVSALSGDGIDAFWEMVLAHHRALEAEGELERKRRRQARDWMWSLVQEGLRGAFDAHEAVAQRIPQAERDVEDQKTTPAAAARGLLEAFLVR